MCPFLMSISKLLYSFSMGCIRTRKQFPGCRAAACTLLLVASVGKADEGMWLFNDLPIESLKQQYGFEPTPAWIEHVRLASVRFNSGGSASFVSSQGLVLTNRHVAADTLQKLSSAEHNYLEGGFLANSHEQELKTPDLELNQLVAIEDVTARVNEAVDASLPASESFRARRAEMAKIEKESLEQTGYRSDVVTLFGGAKYHLYRYKKYTDVRLVWAPEEKAAFFGGDADNFEYPRYNLDVTLFRVYENGKPARIKHFLEYSDKGAQEGELVFVSGNPGRTRRIHTAAALRYLRDKSLPRALDLLRRREILLQQYSYEGEEQRRRAQEELFGIQNRRKAYLGMQRGLLDPAFFANKLASETSFRDQIQSQPELQQFGQAWKKIRTSKNRLEVQANRLASLSRLSRVYEIAQGLVLMAAEDQKPSAERLREFRSSARESLEQKLFSKAPIYEDLERVKLADALAYCAQLRGAEDPFVVKILDGKDPWTRAAELIQGTQLKDASLRRQLAAGGREAIANSKDTMIQLALVMEPEYREFRAVKDEVEEIERKAYADITAAKIALEGTSSYPDATFTLRLAFGTVQGYTEQGLEVPAWTTLGGAYAHEAAHNSQGDWRLPKVWHEHRDSVNLDRPLNFVCTADIIGGNSGSPVINRAGEFVGIIFDGNIQSLTADYLYTDKVSRAVSVHAEGIREALKNIYGAKHLAAELGN